MAKEKQNHRFPAPKDYPSGIREFMQTAPAELSFGTLAVVASALSVYLTRVRLVYPYDNCGQRSAILLHVIVQGAQSSGKSFARYIVGRLLKPFLERDEKQRATEQEYNELKRRKEASSDKQKGTMPKEPVSDITVLPEKVSTTQLLARCSAHIKLFGCTKTMFQFSDELSAIVDAGKALFSNLMQVYKIAYDLGSLYGQEYRSSNSVSAMVDVIMSYVFCGTPHAVSCYMKKQAIEGGNVTRIIPVMLQNQLGCNPPQFRPMTTEQEEALTVTLQRLMDLCYTPEGQLHAEVDLDMTWLNKSVEQWCNGVRAQVAVNMSLAMDTFYKRSSVSAFRIAALLQVLYQLEGTRTQRDIRRLVKQTYLACADTILANMLDRFGGEYEEINNEATPTRFKACDYFKELPDSFSAELLQDYLKSKNIATRPSMVVYRWRKAGLIEKFKAGDEPGIYHKTKKTL